MTFRREAAKPAPAAAPPANDQASVFSALRIVASSTLLSRVLGMFREVASARLFGLGPVWDAFSFAFVIPNLSRRLFGEGALSAAFMPVFARQIENDPQPDRESAWQLASAVFTLLAVFLTVVVLLGEGLLLGLSYACAGQPETQLMLGLTAVMLPYALLICLAAQVTAVLHALGHFTWPALVPVVLNLCWIASIWLVDPLFDPDRVAQVYALAVCIVVAGALQLTMQWPTLRRFGYRFDRRWQAVRPAVREIVRAMLPVTLGLSITQINTVLDRLLAWSLTAPAAGEAASHLPLGLVHPLQPGSVSALYYGERVYQFPLGVFGVALGTVLFPLLARHAARRDLERVRDDLSMGLRLVLAIGVPASIGLALVAEPLMRVLFQHGDFSAEDTARVVPILIAYGAGVWAYCAIPVLYRGFYAVGERRLPVQIGMVAVVLDLSLNLSLVWPFHERGLAASTALSAMAQVALLSILIQRRIGALDWRRLAATSVKALVAALAMSGVYAGAWRAVPPGLGRTGEGVCLVGVISAAAGVYFLAARLLGIEELQLLLRRRAVPEAPAAPDA